MSGSASGFERHGGVRVRAMSASGLGPVLVQVIGLGLGVGSGSRMGSGQWGTGSESRFERHGGAPGRRDGPFDVRVLAQRGQHQAAHLLGLGLGL